MNEMLEKIDQRQGSQVQNFEQDFVFFYRIKMVCKVSIFTQLLVVFLFLNEQIHLIFIFSFIGLKFALILTLFLLRWMKCWRRSARGKALKHKTLNKISSFLVQN